VCRPSGVGQHREARASRDFRLPSRPAPRHSVALRTGLVGQLFLCFVLLYIRSENTPNYTNPLATKMINHTISNYSDQRPTFNLQDRIWGKWLDDRLVIHPSNIYGYLKLLKIGNTRLTSCNIQSVLVCVASETRLASTSQILERPIRRSTGPTAYCTSHCSGASGAREG
jgi:hypothetical protein